MQSRSNLTMVFMFSMAKNSINLSKNYYKVLQVNNGCDQKVIKKSYLKLVKCLHPDVNPNGKQKFTEVQQAYEVLSNQELKKYYDQNNSYSNSNSQKQSSQNYYNSQSTAHKTQNGQEYYRHRTYKSQDPRDYFYQDQEKNRKSKSNKQKYSDQYQNSEQQNQKSSQKSKSTNFNKQQKYARSKASYQEYKRRQSAYQQEMYKNETPEQRQMRDKLKAMRGFTSSYNVLWSRHHIKPSGIKNQNKDKKREEELRKIMPQRIRKYYDLLMEKISKLAEK